MRSKSMPAFWLGLCISLFAICLTPLEVLGQTWEISGSKPFRTNAIHTAAPLRITSAGVSSLQSFRFVGKVGGVSFEAVAAPDASLSGQPISLSYAANEPDGSRLVVRAGSRRLRAKIHDWVLVPTVKFSNTPYHAAVSLFGEGPDTKSYYYIQYHEVLRDTLLGMRMLQADILFINLQNHWQTPRYDNRVLTGAGEPAAARELPRSAAIKLQSAMSGHKWQSWVLTDAGTTPVFSARGSDLEIRAQPYYYFWNIDEADRSSGREPRVYNVTQLTDGMKREGAALAAYNPPVNEAVRKVAQFAALFRYVQSKDPAGWAQFHDAVAKLVVSPAVITPTAWERNR